MVKRASKRSRKEVGDPPNSLKMVLKLSAQEHASSVPTSPSTSAVSVGSDDDRSVGKPSSKKSRTGGSGPQMPAATASAKRDGPVGITASDFVPAERNLRDRHRAPSPKPYSNALQDTLLYLHKLIEKRDSQHFFAFPINDLIAPDYSSVIKNPMDFSTMKEKIDSKAYTSIMAYKADVKLICVNAMNYNHPDTIYYKAAQRLLEYAMKALSKDRLLSLRKNQPMMSSLSDADLSLHLDVDASEYIAPSRQQKKQRDVNSYLTFEPIPDHLPAKDIITIAKERAAEAENNLAKLQPNAKMGFLRMGEDGTTSLNILNPDNTGYISEKEKVITLGEKVGKLKSGLPFIESIPAEDESTDAKCVQYLNYGSFASSAPTYDSRFATLTKKESDMVLPFYGSQNGVDYIQSVKAFLNDGGDDLIKRIDGILDSLTGGKHTEVEYFYGYEGAWNHSNIDARYNLCTVTAFIKAQNLLKESREQASKEAEQQTQQAIQSLGISASGSTGDASKSSNSQPYPSDADTINKPVNYDMLKSIADLGIDVSFLDHFKENDKIQKELDKTSNQLMELHKLQSDRLSLAPSNDKAKEVTEREEKFAKEVNTQLTTLTKQVTPADVTDESKIQSTLGVGLVPTTVQSNSDVVDELLNKEDGARSSGKISPVAALCHSVPLGQSPTDSK